MAKKKRRGTVRMSFRFPRDLCDDITQLSRREDRTKTSIVVRAIRREIAERGTPGLPLFTDADRPAKPVDARPAMA